MLLLAPESGITYDRSDLTSQPDGEFVGAYVFLTPFFGSDLPPADAGPKVSVNGYIFFGDNDVNNGGHLMNLGFYGVSRISPLWADLVVGIDSRIIEHADPGFGYYGVTWENLGLEANPTETATFQAIFFESDTLLGSIQFLAGDIAFSYDGVDFIASGTEMGIGLERGATIATEASLADTNGIYQNITVGEFPVGENEYMLFRPDGNGNYSVSVLPIPEPSSALLVAAGSLLTLRRRR